MRHARTIAPLGSVLVAALLVPLLLTGAPNANAVALNLAANSGEAEIDLEITGPGASEEVPSDHDLEMEVTAAPAPFGLVDRHLQGRRGDIVEVRLDADELGPSFGELLVTTPVRTTVVAIESQRCPHVEFRVWNGLTRADSRSKEHWGGLECDVSVSLEIDKYAYFGDVAGKVEIRDNSSTVASATIGLTVNPRLEFIEQPVDTIVVEGDSARLTVATGGDGKIVGWQELHRGTGWTWTEMAGTSGDVLTIQDVDRGMDMRQYRAVLAAEVGLAQYSDPAMLRVRTVPHFVEEPPERVHVARPGDPYVLTARASETFRSLDESVWWEASGDGETWGPVQETATGSQLSVDAFGAEMDGVRLRALVETDLGRAVSRTALVVVDAPPIILDQPADTRTIVGGEAVFAASTPAISPDRTQQWQERSGDGEWTDLAGATEERLTIESATSDMDQREFRIVFANHFGTTASEPARLTVHQTPPQARISAIATVRLVDRLP